jgi:hypothetical protein
MFQLFQSYIAISVFILQVASVFFFDIAYVSQTYCKYIFQMFHLLQMYVPRVFHVASVSCSEACSESHWGCGKGHGEPRAGGWGTRRPANEVCSSSSQVPSALRERRGQG